MHIRNVTLAISLIACTTPPDATSTAPADTASTRAVMSDAFESTTPDGPLPWVAAFTPPEMLTTERMHLEPLAPRHVELDFAALMGSREHLQRTLHWGDWPRADFTVQENARDLQRHEREFVAREAYAYTVLSPDRTRCLGCVYLEPLPGGGERTVGLAYWVIESELAAQLDRHLLENLLPWFAERWPFDEVVLLNHLDNERGAELADSLGFARDDQSLPEVSRQQPETQLFVWTPPR